VRTRSCRHVGIFDPTKLCARYPHSGLSRLINSGPRKPMDASQRINSLLFASEPVPTFPRPVRAHQPAYSPRPSTSVYRCSKNRETFHEFPFHATCKTPFRPATVLRISFHHHRIRSGPRVSGASTQIVGIFAPQSNSITRRCSLSPGVSFLAPRVAPSTSAAAPSRRRPACSPQPRTQVDKRSKYPGKHDTLSHFTTPAKRPSGRSARSACRSVAVISGLDRLVSASRKASCQSCRKNPTTNSADVHYHELHTNISLRTASGIIRSTPPILRTSCGKTAS